MSITQRPTPQRHAPLCSPIQLIIAHFNVFRGRNSPAALQRARLSPQTAASLVFKPGLDGLSSMEPFVRLYSTRGWFNSGAHARLILIFPARVAPLLMTLYEERLHSQSHLALIMACKREYWTRAGWGGWERSHVDTTRGSEPTTCPQDLHRKPKVFGNE